MAEHQDLVAEMSVLEQMGTQERQKLAKKRRLQQLKKWSQREKELISKEKQLNKRLANLIQEENNGLNLKQYTIYNSNPRNHSSATNNHARLFSNQNKQQAADHQSNNNIHSNNNNNDDDSIDVSKIVAPSSHDSAMKPNSKVQFNNGVMLLEAAARNDYDEVKRLLMLGVSPNSVNHDGLTALHQCCIDASESIMLLLMKFNANVDARDTESWTPLHAACTCGHLNLVKILVENNANLLAVNGDGNMPFDICEDEAILNYIESQMVAQGITQEEIDLKRSSNEMRMLKDLEHLVEAIQSAEQASFTDEKAYREKVKSMLEKPINDNGVTLLHVAAANGYLSCVKFLLNFNVNVSACDNDLWQPIHGVACWGNNVEVHSKVIELLVNSGAKLDSKTINDETVFDLCDNQELIEKIQAIKDELELKKQKAVEEEDDDNRLKRTQSRTNSRIHSVRRTSVRDKNQISRREAREEALLRVESNQSINGNSTSMNGLTRSSQSAPEMIGERHMTNSTKQQTAPSLQNGICEQTDLDGTDEVDGVTRTTINKRSQPNESQNHHIIKSEESNIKSSNNHNHDHNNTSQHSPSSSNNSCSTTSSSNSVSISVEINEASEPMSQKRLAPQVPKNAKQQPNSTNKTACDQKTSSASSLTANKMKHTSNVTIGHSNNLQQQLEQQQNQITLHPQANGGAHQFTPINYTLSNLKKQRSDLRMRTTSIGGSSSVINVVANTSKTSINGHQIKPTQQEQQQQVVLLDPQPSSLVLSNGQQLNGQKQQQQLTKTSSPQQVSDANHRPESPSLTFRKFSGEASETIGYGNNTKHKLCCIVM